MEPEPTPKAWRQSPAAAPAASRPDAPALLDAGLQDEHRHRRRRTGRKYGSSHFRKGRVVLVAVFFALRAVDVLIYLLARAEPAGFDRARLVSFLVCLALWTTSLLVGMWLRQAWARYLMIAFVFLSGLVELLWLPSAFFEVPGPILQPILTAIGVIHAGILYALIGIPAVRRLTSQAYD